VRANPIPTPLLPLAAAIPGRQPPQAREPVAEQRPDERQVAHVHGDAALARVPEHVAGVPDVGGVEDLGEDRGDDDEGAQAEDEEEDELLPPGDVEAGDERQGDEEHQGVGGDVEAGLHYGVVLEGGALWVWRRHCPVPFEGSAGCKESDCSGKKC